MLEIFDDIALLKEKSANISVKIDGDTSAMAGTKNAALRAVGAVAASVDLVYGKDTGKTGRAANPNLAAFCLVRPPGHHAGPDSSGGFCFFNNDRITVFGTISKLFNWHNSGTIFDFETTTETGSI